MGERERGDDPGLTPEQERLADAIYDNARDDRMTLSALVNAYVMKLDAEEFAAEWTLHMSDMEDEDDD